MTDSRIPTARLGESGPEVGVQGLGCMGMSFAYGPVDAKESRATLERALELGVTLYDTADAYGVGENEKFLSPFFRANRDQLVIATKFALSIPPDDPTRRVIRNDAPYIRQAVEASLKRLDVDVIDLYYMHRRDVNVPIEDTVGVMAELVREGKVKHLGLSEVTAQELRTAQAVHPIAAVQSEWSLFSRDIEANVVQAARELGVALVPYSRSAAASSPAPSPTPTRTSPPTTSGASSPASPARTRPRTCPCWSRSARWPRPTARRWDRSPSPGSSSRPPCTTFR